MHFIQRCYRPMSIGDFSSTNMLALRRSKHLKAMFRLLLLLLHVSSTLAVFRGRIFVRLLCYDHPSSVLQGGAPCDQDGDCDPEFIFCFFNSTNRGICNLGRSVFNFHDSPRLGVCNRNRNTGNNVPDPLAVNITTTVAEVSLSLRINDVDRSHMFERRGQIDELTFRLMPTGLRTLPNGQPPRPEYYSPIKILSRTFKNITHPRVQLAVAVQCPVGFYGPACEKVCTATDQFLCLTNGSRQCRIGWTGANCTERDFCAGKPCKSWAVCSPTPGGFQCTCDGATGPQCERDGDPCYNNRCANNASCLGVSGRPVCMCREGWQGRLCRQRHPCFPSPCGANGRCLVKDTLVRCDCLEGFRGPNCNETATAPPPEEKPKKKNVPGKVPPQFTAMILLFIIIGVILVAVLVVAGRCYWQRWRAKKEKKRCASLSTLSNQRASPHTSITSPYDESHVSVSMDPKEDPYETPGPMYSMIEEENEEDVNECTAFRPETSEQQPRLSSGSRSVHFDRT